MRGSPAVLSLLFFLALALSPAAARAGWDEGIANFKAKNYEAAAAEFRTVVDQNPEGYQGHLMLGRSLQQLKRDGDALPHLRKAYDLNPNDLSVKVALSRTHYVLGAAALRLGRLDEAITALGDAERLDPKDPNKKRALATALVRKGRTVRGKDAKKAAYGEAFTVSTALVALSPSYENLILQSSAALGGSLYPQAIEAGKAAVAAKGDDWLSHYYLGQAYTGNRQYPEAEVPLLKASGLASSFGDLALIWKQLGYAYERQRKYAEAITAYEKAGDEAGVARATESAEIVAHNKMVEEENRRIAKMAEEAKKLEEELKALEDGGG